MELLSPAGSLQKLQYAIYFGADAVYCSGKDFGLRAKSTNLSDEELEEAVKFCHSQNKKIFVTVNIFAQNSDLKKIKNFLLFLEQIKIDAVIISDPGVFALAKENAPQIPIHVSTQANVTSWKTAEFWLKQGAKRIISARELSITEIKEIKQRVPEIELEMFVHGAMCMSYSGRCLLSSYLNDRSANRGNCTQPCRWKYALTEETRPGQFFPIEEDEHGTYILNSKDLCLFDRLEEIKDAGIDSIKIEGRMKSMYYVANLTRIYREALDLIEEGQIPSNDLNAELDKVSHRIYSEAFFDQFDSSYTQNYDSSSYIRNYQFIGEIADVTDSFLEINCKAKFSVGEEIEIIFPDRKSDISILVKSIYNEENEPIDSSKPNTVAKINLQGFKNLFKNLQGFKNLEGLDHGIVRKRICNPIVPMGNMDKNDFPAEQKKEDHRDGGDTEIFHRDSSDTKL